MEQKHFDNLVEIVTKKIMQKLNQDNKKFLVLGRDEDCPINSCLNKDFISKVDSSLQNMEDYDYVVLPVGYLQKLIGKGEKNINNFSKEEETVNGEILDFTDKKLIHEREIKDKYKSKIIGIRVGKKTIITQLALDFIKQKKIQVIREQ